MSVPRVQTNLRRLLVVCAVLLSMTFAPLVATHMWTHQRDSRPAPRSMTKGDVLTAYGKLPLVFEKNIGQTDSRVQFLARAGGYTLFLTDREAVLRLTGPRTTATARPRTAISRPIRNGQNRDNSVVRLAFGGSTSASQVEGLEQQAGHSNYLIGRDPSRWEKNVPLYGRVKYHDVYPGIDAVYYGNQSRLETDYVVAPGADPRGITLQISGGKQVNLNPQGDLVITSTSGDLILRRPNVYQEIEGTPREIAANYVRRSGRSVGIEVGNYDSTRPLVVDPVVVYSTYLGGATAILGNALSPASGVAVDSTGNAYVAGSTDTSDFPTTPGDYQSKNNSGALNANNAFIAKFDPAKTGAAGLIYSTYLGGSGSDGAAGIGIDASGNAYVTGTTSSVDFPVAPNASAAIQPVAPTKTNFGAPSGFFAELDQHGASLLYSTYLGGNGSDRPAGIAVLEAAPDGNPNAYIVGSTTSTNFPFTPTALQATNNTASGAGSSDNVFLSQIDPTKSGLNALIYSTYLGGSTNDIGSAIAVDATSNAYITGSAASSNFPTSTNAFQSGFSGSRAATFLARIDTVNSRLLYSTFLGGGGPGPDSGNCVAVDSNFNAYVGGHTYDMSFPVTSGAFETTFPGVKGIGTGFVARLDTAAAQASATLVWATYLGGQTSGDQPHGIGIDSAGNAYLTGETWSGNFPVTLGAPYPTGTGGSQNGFVSVLSANGSKLTFSTFYGTGGPGQGLNTAAGLGLALDSASSPDVFIVGATTSSKFPVTQGAVQTTLNGFQDAFVAELSPAAAQGVFLAPSPLSFANQPKGTTSSPQTVTLANNTQSAITVNGYTITGTNAGDFKIQTNNCPASGSTLAAETSCTLLIVFTPSTTTSESATLSVSDTGAGSPQTVTMTGTGTTPPAGVTLTPSSANFGSVNQGATSSPQTFTLTNNSQAAITIASPNGFTITGTNAGDFKIQTNNCPASGSTLAAGTTCTLSVVFTPSTTSSESATLNAFDSDSSSPQTASLSGTGRAPSGGVTVAPTSLSFGNVNINTTSAAQTVTLTNGKVTALTINSVTVTGPNASDFAGSSKCGTTLPGSSNCTISVTFTPTTSAAESAMLSISDSDPSSPQTVALSGTGAAPKPDFTISATPTAATVGTPGTVTTTVTVTSAAGFSSAVTLSCSSLPGDATCAFSQNPVTPAANGSASSTVTISTSVGVIAGAASPYSTRWPRPPAWVWVFVAVGVALAGMRTEKRGPKRVACALALLSLAALAGCTGTPSTPTGTYAVHLTGRSASVNHSFQFMLTVK